MTETLDSSTSAAVEPVATEMVVVLDFGSQYSQLITRRVREAGVYCELFHHDTPWARDRVAATCAASSSRAVRPASTRRARRNCRTGCWRAGCRCSASATACSCWPHALGGSVEPADRARVRSGQDHGSTATRVARSSPDCRETLDVWMSHGDHVAKSAGRLRPDRPERQRALRRDRQGHDRRDPVPPRGRAHPAGQGHPAQLPDRDLRLRADLDARTRSSTARSSRSARRSATAGSCSGSAAASIRRSRRR